MNGDDVNLEDHNYIKFFCCFFFFQFLITIKLYQMLLKKNKVGMGIIYKIKFELWISTVNIISKKNIANMSAFLCKASTYC